MFSIAFLRGRFPSSVLNFYQEWLADQLPHPNTTVFEVGEACTRDSGRRMLTCGPFLTLGKGYYEFSITFRSPAATHQVSGFWDITADKGTKVLDRGPLLGTLGESSTLRIVLFIDRKQSDVEFRSYSEGVETVFVKSIRIKRLEDHQR